MKQRILPWIRGACALSVVALFPGCGVRSQLRGAEPCPREGEVRTCQGVCGEGTTTCKDGYFTDCDIPPRQEACEDVCGIGLRNCQNEMWSDCFVEPTVETCENECGTGLSMCRDHAWDECMVEPVYEECTFGCGPGIRTCIANSWSSCDAPRPLPPALEATIRDFSVRHPDFERDLANGAGQETGIVESTLGSDGKPVYAGGPMGTLTTTGPEYFDQWYRDVPGVNESTQITITLQTSSASDDFYVYEDRQFFPIDNQLLGNEGNNHNFHFTLEAEASFVYREGQVFAFDGDDDIWVFINDRLVIDLGGLHESLRADVALDDVADEIGIAVGEEYPLKIFFAERHTVDSNFVIETSIADLGECPD